jgi:hypothetical protein
LNLRRLANDVIKLSYRAERISMLLHWPLYWLARALDSAANVLDKRASKETETNRQQVTVLFAVVAAVGGLLVGPVMVDDNCRLIALSAAEDVRIGGFRICQQHQAAGFIVVRCPALIRK